MNRQTRHGEFDISVVKGDPFQQYTVSGDKMLQTLCNKAVHEAIVGARHRDKGPGELHLQPGGLCPDLSLFMPSDVDINDDCRCQGEEASQTEPCVHQRMRLDRFIHFDRR